MNLTVVLGYLGEVPGWPDVKQLEVWAVEVRGDGEVRDTFAAGGPGALVDLAVYPIVTSMARFTSFKRYESTLCESFTKRDCSRRIKTMEEFESMEEFMRLHVDEMGLRLGVSQAAQDPAGLSVQRNSSGMGTTVTAGVIDRNLVLNHGTIEDELGEEKTDQGPAIPSAEGTFSGIGTMVHAGRIDRNLVLNYGAIENELGEFKADRGKSPSLPQTFEQS
ncbi:hypothetical protein BDZ45DRAFT_731931 [Acephala macrosclerotiorum]|nr:hypothetical protein BDZ45DRAFT_731931 [Acephala macrosclerotiorum]